MSILQPLNFSFVFEIILLQICVITDYLLLDTTKCFYYVFLLV